MKALTAMAADRPVRRGALSERLQAAIDVPTAEGIDALAEHLAGGRPAAELRSEAIRTLLRRGAEAMLADELAEA